MRKAATRELEVEDQAGLTDADWLEINKLRAAYRISDDAYTEAIELLCAKDWHRFLTVWFAIDPIGAREDVKDLLAERGIDADDIRKIIRRATQ